jgi:hypothetical protein
MLAHRVNVSIFVLTNVILGILTSCPLGLLLYLTDFSPVLRTIVWFIFISLCFHMVRNYIRHSNLVELPQQYPLSTDPTIGKKPIKGERNTIDLILFERKEGCFLKRLFPIKV